MDISTLRSERLYSFVGQFQIVPWRREIWCFSDAYLEIQNTFPFPELSDISGFCLAFDLWMLTSRWYRAQPCHLQSVLRENPLVSRGLAAGCWSTGKPTCAVGSSSYAFIAKENIWLFLLLVWVNDVCCTNCLQLISAFNIAQNNKK